MTEIFLSISGHRVTKLSPHNFVCMVDRPDDPLPTPVTVLRSTSTPTPPVCSFVSYILMCVCILVCYILYIEEWEFQCEVRLQTCKTITNGVPDPRCCPGQTPVMFKFQHPVDLFHALKTVNFCYMFSSGPSSGSTGSVQIYRIVCDFYTPNMYRCIRI